MSSFVKVTPTVALRILELQEYRCALTGRVLTPDIAVMDHIIPLARGGEHSASNIWILHKDANRAKGQLLLDELYAMCGDALNHRAVAERLRCLAAAGWHKAAETVDVETHKEKP